MSREVIDKYFDAINKEDWEGFAGILDADVVYQTTGARPRQGRDQVVAYFGTLFRAWKTHYDGPAVYIVDGDRAAVEVRFRGTSLSGADIEFHAVDVFHFRDGKIASLVTWYDVNAVRHLLETTP